MRGVMLWFNADKGYGYIQTEDDERLYVGRTAFLPEHEPPPRCKGQHVSFERRVADDGAAEAVGVSFVDELEQRRARLRHPRGGTAL